MHFPGHTHPFYFAIVRQPGIILLLQKNTHPSGTILFYYLAVSNQFQANTHPFTVRIVRCKG